MYSLADLREFAKKKGWCPYFLARHWLAFANVVVYNYQYMIDPKVSQVGGGLVCAAWPFFVTACQGPCVRVPSITAPAPLGHRPALQQTHLSCVRAHADRPCALVPLPLFLDGVP
mgnify:CR=1 FL=1